MGWKASDTRALTFADCVVPEGNLLGARGKGFNQFLEILDGGRISVAAMGVGLAQGAYDLATAYAQERTQFGKPIGTLPGVAFKLADMAVEIEAGRQLVYKAAWLKDQGRPFALEAAMAKLYTGELSQPGRQPGAPDPRRLRLHRRVRDLAPLPRPEDPRDRRGHERGAADGDREAPRALSRRRPESRVATRLLVRHLLDVADALTVSHAAGRAQPQPLHDRAVPERRRAPADRVQGAADANAASACRVTPGRGPWRQLPCGASYTW